MSRKVKYSKQLKLEVVKMYLNGESNVKLAQEFNIGQYGKNINLLFIILNCYP